MTIKDIARISGCSVSTISRVINDRPDVRPETKEHVLKVMREAGFTPNTNARQLKIQQSRSLGEHLLFEEGAEGAGADGNPRGLGVLPGCVDRMPRQDAEGRAYKVPHVGWNTVDIPAGAPENPLFAGIPSGTYFYFTHSYIAPDGPFAIAHTTHSMTFPCAVQKGNAFGVQFHPEKSSDAGAAVLRNFVEIVKAASPALQG